MATKSEREELRSIQSALVKLSTDIMAQADAVTDRVTWIRLSRKAQDAWKLAERVQVLAGDSVD